MVSKWVGKHEENSGGVEAELDIQYIMGQAVGIKTEFWEFPGMDFGADLNQWTSNLTTVAGVPIVHSVSCAHLTAPFPSPTCRSAAAVAARAAAAAASRDAVVALQTAGRAT